MLLSTHPLSALTLSDSGRAIRLYLHTELALDLSLIFSIRVASRAGFATAPDDELPSTPFRGVLRSYALTRSIIDSELGVFRPPRGTLRIRNADGHYDPVVQRYSADAQPIAVKVHRLGDSFDDAFQFGALLADSLDVDLDTLTLSLRDRGYLLDVPMQPRLYGGTGGADGGDDLKGKRIPLVFGKAREISPPRLGALPIYQINDGPFEAVLGVRDKGVQLTFAADYATYAALAAASISASHYATCLAQGYIRLGSEPTGLVTADVKGDNRDGYVETTADIVRWAIRNCTEIADPDDLHTSSFDALNAAQPAKVNYWIGPEDSIRVADFVANLMGGIGGWGGHRRDGGYAVRRFEAPAGVPAISITRGFILGENEPQRGELPSNYNPPPWRWRVAYARAWTVQNELAGGVDGAHKAFVAEQFRLATAENEAIKVDHPTAQDREPVQSFFDEEADALAEAERRLALFGASRRIYSVTVPREALARDLGDVGKLTFPRFDLSVGKLVTIVEIDEGFDVDSGGIDSVGLKVYG